MRRATSAARAVSGLDVRDPDRDDSGISIPTLSWPPDPPSYESITRQGNRFYCLANCKVSLIFNLSIAWILTPEKHKAGSRLYQCLFNILMLHGH